ncbi:colorectal cancer associated 2 [Odontesthes bonariensis]|uniref:colorectal cancer associated 2 n=1 Tax=Odontesthes bonariensis TaxID=219752 RepID=UPI003F5810DA
MSEKPRVYLGVRVKTTVKELLQRHRAREANNKKPKTAYLELKELSGSIFSTPHADPPPAAPQTDSSRSASRAPQQRTSSFLVPDGSGTIQMSGSAFNGIHQQFGDGPLPCNGYNNNNGGAIDYNAPLPPLTTSSPLPWCHGLPSDADYHGHGMAACSSSESLTPCNPMDHNSYSPQDSFSSSPSSCYDSPTRMESSYCGFSSEYCHYQHYNPQQDCVPGCWPGQQEILPTPDYTPYYNPTDYPFACPVEDSYFRKDFPLSTEMCYNVL